MEKSIFITGTDTDSGKTFVTALIVKKFLDAGISAGYYKAAASGEKIENISADAFYVKKISGLQCNMKNFVSYSFENSFSPHLAAKIENKKINFSVIEKNFRFFDGRRQRRDNLPASFRRKNFYVGRFDKKFKFIGDFGR